MTLSQKSTGGDRDVGGGAMSLLERVGGFTRGIALCRHWWSMALGVAVAIA